MEWRDRGNKWKDKIINGGIRSVALKEGRIR
jgi:hypothetical protein